MMNKANFEAWLQEDEHALPAVMHSLLHHIAKTGNGHRFKISRDGVKFGFQPFLQHLNFEWTAELMSMVIGDIMMYMEDEPDVTADQWQEISEMFTGIVPNLLYKHRVEFNIPVSLVVSSRDEELILPDPNQRMYDLIRDHIVPDAIEFTSYRIRDNNVDVDIDADEF